MEYESEHLRPELLEGALKVAQALDQFKINYALIGGLAAGVRTHPRATRDVDVLLSVPQIVLPKVLEVLEQHDFKFDLLTTIRQWTDHHLAVLSYRGVQVDWLKAVLPVYQHVLDRATDETWYGQRIRVASADGLILMKLIADRTQDWVDIENLVATQLDHLDLDWIRQEWQALAAPDDPRMARFLEHVAKARK